METRTNNQNKEFTNLMNRNNNQNETTWDKRNFYIVSICVFMLILCYLQLQIQTNILLTIFNLLFIASIEYLCCSFVLFDKSKYHDFAIFFGITYLSVCVILMLNYVCTNWSLFGQNINFKNLMFYMGMIIVNFIADLLNFLIKNSTRYIHYEKILFLFELIFTTGFIFLTTKSFEGRILMFDYLIFLYINYATCLYIAWCIDSIQKIESYTYRALLCLSAVLILSCSAIRIIILLRNYTELGLI